MAAYVGIMQADRFAGYSDLYDARRKPAPIVEAACWIRGRCKLFDIAKLDRTAETKAGIGLGATARL